MKDALILILLDVCNVSRILVEDLCYLTVRYWLANYLINLLSAFLDFAITAHPHTHTHAQTHTHTVDGYFPGECGLVACPVLIFFLYLFEKRTFGKMAEGFTGPLASSANVLKGIQSTDPNQGKLSTGLILPQSNNDCWGKEPSNSLYSGSVPVPTLQSLH